MRYLEAVATIDKAFRSARSSYNAALADLKAGEVALADAKRNYGSTHSKEAELAQARASVKLADAEKRFDQAKTAYTEVSKTARKLGDELRAQILAGNRLNPTQIDESCMMLLKSGIATTTDICGLIDQYKNNMTMIRVLQKEIDNRLAATKQREERAVLINAGEMVKKMLGADELTRWERIEKAVETATGTNRDGTALAVNRSRDYLAAASAQWETLTNGLIDS